MKGLAPQTSEIFDRITHLISEGLAEVMDDNNDWHTIDKTGKIIE